MLIRPVGPADAEDWERMRQSLWPSPPGEHAREIARFLGGYRHDPAEVFVAVDGQGRLIGFAEVSIRSHAEGCESHPVAYLEGWFVERASRRRGAGAALVRAAEQWGRGAGCTELASDTEVENAVSTSAHLALGFTEVSRIVCFRRSLR